jgi:hypothetical protein
MFAMILVVGCSAFQQKKRGPLADNENQEYVAHKFSACRAPAFAEGD